MVAASTGQHHSSSEKKGLLERSDRIGGWTGNPIGLGAAGFGRVQEFVEIGSWALELSESHARRLRPCRAGRGGLGAFPGRCPGLTCSTPAACGRRLCRDCSRGPVGQASQPAGEGGFQPPRPANRTPANCPPNARGSGRPRPARGAGSPADRQPGRLPYVDGYIPPTGSMSTMSVTSSGRVRVCWSWARRRERAVMRGRRSMIW